MKINVIDRSTASIIIFNKMVKMAPLHTILEHFSVVQGEPEVEVKCTVNGVEIDIVEALTDAWVRLEKRFDEAVNDRAFELMSTDHKGRLEAIDEIVREAQEKIREL